MAHRSIALVLAFGLVAATASASTASPLTGTYRVTIAGKPAPLDGKWQLEFLRAGAVEIVRNGHVVVVGRAVVTGNRVRLTDRSGPYACSSAQRTGVYTFKATRDRVTFAPVSDKCVGRRLILTTKAFVK